MIVAIHQPNFLPWLGYFHKLIHSDVFVFFDDVQFPRGKSYCSRVKIKGPRGEMWLTVPVEGKSSLKMIHEIKMSKQQPWKSKHLKTLEANYKKAPYFDEIFPLIKQIYEQGEDYLADFNIKLIEIFCIYLGVPTKLVRSSQMQIEKRGGLEHILNILKIMNADIYLTGTGAGSDRYIDEHVFFNNNIELKYQSFSHPVYTQQWGGFIPNLSMIDLLFNHGKNSLDILKQSSN